MLQRIRDGLHGRKWLAVIALAPIVLIFALWGGSNSLDFNGTSKQNAATVNGEKIPAIKATSIWNDVQARWSRQNGTEIPADQRAKMQDSILDSLVFQKVLEQRFADQGFRVSNARVLQEFHNFQPFKDENGNYDPDRARYWLLQNNQTENDYFDETRLNLLLNQMERGIGASYFLTRAEAQRLYNLDNEEREIQYLTLPADKFAGSDAIDEAAIKAYYDKNGDRFMTTESAAVDYAELRLENLATQVTPTDNDLKKLYDDNKLQYVVEEQRRARHIVIAVEGTDDAAALKKAEAVLAEAKAGKDFAELAKKYSADPTTAKDGGEIGFVQHKDFVGPFGDALFAMKVGDISGPVKSQFGYHLIKLEEIQPGQSKPFEAVRAELDSQYRKQRAAELFGDRQEQIAEQLEKGDEDLGKLAETFGLTRGSVPEFLRGGGAEPLGSSPDMQQLVFGDAVLNQGKVGGPIALGEDRLVLVKVTAHHKAAVKPLPVVRDQIVALLRHDRGVAAAKAAADAALPKLVAGEKLEAIATTLNVSAEPARFVSHGDPSIPAALRTAIFESQRPDAKPVVKATALDDGSAVLYIVTRTRVSDTTANPQLVQQQRAELQKRASQGDFAAYANEVKRQAKIVKNPEVFE
jgi:peptidyl-prolyl cis-trans isomerase D